MLLFVWRESVSLIVSLFLAQSIYSRVRLRLFVAWNIRAVVFSPPILGSKYCCSVDPCAVYFILFIFLLFNSFSHKEHLLVFQWSLKDSKFTHVSRTRLSNLPFSIMLSFGCSPLGYQLSSPPVLLIIILLQNLLLLFLLIRVFHISVSWWFFTGVWVTASLLKSPGFVTGFWPFSTMLSFG